MKRPIEPFRPVKPQKYEYLTDNLSFAWKKQFNLNDLFKMLPKGVKRKDIIFSTIEVGEEEYLLKISYSIKRINPNYNEQLIIYNIASSVYEKKMENYHKNMKKYTNWSLSNEIKEHQKVINTLKIKLKNGR